MNFQLLIKTKMQKNKEFSCSECLQLGKMSGKTLFFSRPGKLSGNFKIGQGNLKIEQQIREKAGNFEIASL